MRADWVRLHAGLAPPHWVEGRGATWDAGYESTAYFLDWLEARYGYGLVAELNLLMKTRPWDEALFKELTGRKLAKLWALYKEWLAGGKKAIEKEGEGGAPPPVPTHTRVASIDS